MAEQNELDQMIVDGDSAGHLIATILDIEYRDLEQKVGRLLAKLHNAGKISLFASRNLQAIQQLEHNDFWMVFGALSDAIEHVIDEYPAAQRYAECLVEKAGNDGASNTPFAAFVRWCSANPAQAKRILSGAKEGKEDCLRSGVFALQGLNEFSNLTEFLEDDRSEIRSVGFRGLGRIKNVSLEDDKAGIDACLSEIQANSSADARNAAIEAAFRIWGAEQSESKYRQEEFVEALLAQPTDEVLVRLCAMLFYHKDAPTKQTIEAVLSKSQNLTSGFDAASNWIDSALNWKDDRWSFKHVVAFIETAVPHLEQPATTKKFRSFCDWVWEEPANASYLFARWLNSGDFARCSFLAEMVSGVDKGRAVSLFGHDVPPKAVDQVFLARKCIGFLWLHEITSASILLSLVEHGHLDAISPVEELLWEPLLLSYSSELRPFLEAQTTSACGVVSEAAKRLIDRHAAYTKGLEKVQDVSELEPSNEARRAAAIKDHHRNAEIQKQARKMSVFADLVHTTTMLYGRKSYTMITGADGQKFPSITPLSEHTYSFEFPRLSVVDPVGFNGLISVCRVEQRKTK